MQDIPELGGIQDQIIFRTPTCGSFQTTSQSIRDKMVEETNKERIQSELFPKFFKNRHKMRKKNQMLAKSGKKKNY